jgi:hypothetical protein
VVTCSLGNLANGVSATVSIVVTTTTVGLITNTASVSGAEPDPNTRNNTTTEKTRVKQAPLPAVGKIKFTGVVQSMPADGFIGTWTIQGLKVIATPVTEIEGTPSVGSIVKVEGRITSDGVVHAREIKVKKAELKIETGKVTICLKPGTRAEKTLTLPRPAADRLMSEHVGILGPCVNSQSALPKSLNDDDSDDDHRGRGKVPKKPGKRGDDH